MQTLAASSIHHQVVNRMTDNNDFKMSDNDALLEDADIDKLIRTAGPRPAIPKEVRDRVEPSVKSAWRETVNERKAARLNKRPRFRVIKKRIFLASAACFVVTVASVNLLRDTHTAPVPGAARVAFLTGDSYINSGEKKQPLRRDASLYSGQTINTAKNAGVALNLGKNQSLRVGQTTQLRIISAREFELIRGKIYFDSGNEDNTMPINIHTDFGVVSDIGTQFEVQFAPTDMRMRVREGEIEFDAKKDGADKTIGATQDVQLTADGKTNISKIAPDSIEWRWATALAPIHQLEGYDLDQYLKILVRENGWSLQYESPDLENYAKSSSLNGSIKGMSSEQALAAVTAISEVGFDLNNRTLTIFMQDQ